MERVAFLVEETGERLGCLLNPGSVVVRRTAGVRSRRSPGGPLVGAQSADDALLFTGGGRTEIHLDLLFDVQLSGSSVRTSDVRDLTAPLWALAENRSQDGGPARPPRVRFVWGKLWNVSSVVEAVAERFERFTEDGTPQRSWLRMRLLRVPEPPAPPPPEPPDPERLREVLPDLLDEIAEPPGGEEEPGTEVPLREIAPGEGPPRLDLLAHRETGNAALWRLFAGLAHLDDPLNAPPDALIRLPPPDLLERLR